LLAVLAVAASVPGAVSGLTFRPSGCQAPVKTPPVAGEPWTFKEAASLKVTFIPVSSEPYGEPELTPIRFKSTENPEPSVR